MNQANPPSGRTQFLLPVTLLFFLVLTAVNLWVGVRVLRDPGSFPASHWDLRWAVIFLAGFLLVGLLTLLSRHKALVVLTLAGSGLLVLLPIFTLGAGPAYLVLVLLLLVAYGAGEFFLRLLLGSRLSSAAERFPLAVLIGLGLIEALVMLQGMLFLFQPLVTWIGLAVLVAVFVLPNLKRWYDAGRAHLNTLRPAWANESLPGWAFAIGILAVLWVPSWLIAMAPANRYDEMTYHLTAPLAYIERGGIVPLPGGWMHYAEMLYTLAMQTAGQPLPRLLHLSLGLLCTLLVFLFGRRLVNARVGIATALLFFAAPVVGYETATAYIDLFVTAYTTAFGFALLAWWQERNPRWLLVAGVLGGLGLGTKLTAGSMVAGLLAVFVVVLLLRRRSASHLRCAAVMLGLTLALALPWLIRDYLWMGDPFYPYGSMFMQRITSSLSAATSAAAPLGPGRWLRLLQYPLDLVINSRLYYHEAPGGFASALPLLAFPLFFFFPSIPRSVKAVLAVLLAASFLALGTMIAVNNVLLRYALPTFPWLALSAALNLEALYTWFSARKVRWGIALLGLALLGYAFSTRLPLIMRLYDNLPQRFPLNYVLGRETRQAFLSRTLGVYDAFQFIDSQPGGPHKVFSVGNEFRMYTVSQIDSIYDTAEATAIASSAQTPADLARSLQDSGYDYLLLNQAEVEFVAWKYRDPFPILQDTSFWDTYAELLFVDDGFYVYRFAPNGVQLPPAVNLLQNEGFEEVQGSDFMDWDEYGAVEFSTDAFQGQASLVVHAPLSPTGGGYVAQKVPVEPGQLYTLGYWLKSAQPTAFLMQLKWLDAQGNVLGSVEEWENTTAEWQWHYRFASSPEGTQFAVVYASTSGEQAAWVDAACLAQGQRCPK